MLAPSALLRPQRADEPERSYRVLLKIPRKPSLGLAIRISLALACPRLNRRRPPRGIGAGDLARAAVFAVRVESALNLRVPPSAIRLGRRLPAASGVL